VQQVEPLNPTPASFLVPFNSHATEQALTHTTVLLNLHSGMSALPQSISLACEPCVEDLEYK
jgi:hypothetical protein